jgi:hypothetical protein
MKRLERPRQHCSEELFCNWIELKAATVIASSSELEEVFSALEQFRDTSTVALDAR